MLLILEIIGIIVGTISTIWVVVTFFIKRVKLKKYFNELSLDTLEINKIKEKYNSEFMLYIGEINYRVHFHLYSNRKQINELIKIYVMYTNSPQFKYVYLKYSNEDQKFVNRRRILFLNKWMRHIFLKYKLNLIHEDINNISEYVEKTGKYLDMGYDSKDKFMATSGDLHREFSILSDIFKNNIFVLHSHAGDGKTFISNFHSELLLKRKKTTLFLDSLSINKKLSDLNKLTKEFLNYKTLKSKVFLMDGLNEFILSEDEITSYIHSLTKFRKRDRIIVTTRTIHYEKYFTFIPNVHDFSFKYYQFLNSMGRHDELRKNILVDLYCSFYEINRHKIGIIGDYIFTQMLLVKIYFRLLKDNLSLKINNKNDLFVQYLGLIRKNCSDKLEFTVTDIDLNRVFSYIIEERINSVDILYSNVIANLNVPDKKILEFLIDEEIVLRKEEKNFSSGNQLLLIFNFDDIRDYLIVNDLFYKYSDYSTILEKYEEIIDKIDNIAEGTYEHLLLSTSLDNQDILLKANLNQINEELKIRLLIKNGIFNDYFSENIDENYIFTYSKEIAEIILKSLVIDREIPGDKRFKEILKGNIYNRIDLLDDFRNRIGRDKLVIGILMDVINNSDKYNKEDVLILVNLLMDANEGHKEIVELRDQIIAIYQFRRV